MAHLIFRPADDAAVWVDAVELDVNAYPLHALRIMLAVEFLLVQPCAKLTEATAQLWHHVGKKGRLVLHRKRHVIDKTLVVYAERQHPLIYFMEVIVYGVLPYQMADSRSYAVGLLKEAFARLHLLPFPKRAFPVAMVCRIAIDAYHQHIKNLIKVLAVIVCQYHLFQLLVGNVLNDVWETAAHIDLDNPRIAGEPMRDLIDVTDKGVLASVLTHANAVVEGVVTQPCLQ